MHKTTAGEKRKALKAEAVELARSASAAMKAAKILPEARGKARTLEDRAASLQAEAEALKGAARLEDLTVWERRRPDHQEGQDDIRLLDVLMERRR